MAAAASSQSNFVSSAYPTTLTTPSPTLPLTTIFTAPSSCLSTLTLPLSGDPHYVLGDGPQCIPSGAATTDRSYAFSPALQCPQSYTTVFTTTLTSNTLTETRAICCPVPSGLSGFPNVPFLYNADSTLKPWYSTYGCTLSLQKPQQVTIAYDGELYETILSLGNGLNAYSVQIAWQATDVPAMTTSSAQAMSTASISPSNPSGSSGLATSSLIAVAVVVPVVGLALIFLSFWAFKVWRRKRVSRPHFQTGPGMLLETSQNRVV